MKDGVTREVRGETVWYLLLAEPELCRQHLLPLLEMLRSDWRLVETAQAIESQMLRIAEAYQPENLRRWDCRWSPIWPAIDLSSGKRRSENCARPERS